MLIPVFRVGDQNALKISKTVHAFVDEKKARLPEGLSISAVFLRFQAWFAGRLRAFIHCVYQPILAAALRARYFTISVAIGVMTAEQAKALAVFLNSTPGRLQLVRNLGSTLAFPQYNTESVINIRVPDVVGDGGICRALAECWEETKNIKVPQYRDGDDWDRKHSPRNPQPKPAHFQNPRPIWDKCVSQVLRKNPLFKLRRLNALRKLLHREPHIRGKSYNDQH